MQKLALRSVKGSAVFFAVLLALACNYKDIPTEFPTPEPPAPAGPAPRLELKSDPALSGEFVKIAEDVKGKVGALAVVLETGESAGLNADHRFPMQSVYKLPICMAVMDQVRLGNLDLEERIGVTKEDMVRPGFASELRDKNPEGGEFTIRELLRLSIVESDGTASDVLLRLAGGPGQVQSYLTSIGVKDLAVVNSEKEISKDWDTQYQNWGTPAASVELLRWLYLHSRSTERGPDADESRSILLSFMAASVPGAKRLKGALPEGTYVAHKTGTGGTQDRIASATNDMGIIDMPNGKHLLVAVFISDSSTDLNTREKVIARIARAAFDRWSR